MFAKSIACSTFLVVAAGLSLTLVSEPSSAKDIPAQARLFAGVNSVSPDNLNTELSAQSLKKVDVIGRYGVDINFPILKFFDAGLRYTKRYTSVDESTSNPATDYKASIDQDSVAAVVRVPAFRSAIIRADAFAAFGGANTVYKIRTATQDGELDRKAEGSWLATPYTAYGASVAIGWKQVYLVIEGGVESNKIDNFKRVGTINGNVTTIDLSGSYVSVGLLFDGVSAYKK